VLKKLLSFLLTGGFDEIKYEVGRTCYCTVKAQACNHQWVKVTSNPNVQGDYSVCSLCNSVLFEGSEKPLLASDPFELVELGKIATDEYKSQMIDRA